MNISLTKVEITKNILETENPVVLKHIAAILDAYKTDIWVELSESQKKSVKKAQNELSNGKGKPHDEVMKKHSKWLTNNLVS